MYSLIYTSTAQPSFDSSAIFKMLLKAKRYNREKKISGCIIFHEGTFLQLLEGEEDEVKKLYETIEHDSRHFNFKTLIQKKETSRLWEDWSMAFYDFSQSGKNYTQKRNLLEIYFNTAQISESSKEVFNTFKDAALKLLH